MLSLATLSRRIAALLTLALIIYLLIQEDQGTTGPEYVGSKIARPYATLETGTIRQFNAEGKTAVVLSMDEALYYEASDAVEMQAPRMLISNAEGQRITVQAERGHYHPTAQVLNLSKNVSVVQKDHDNPDVVIRTDTLMIDNRSRFISSDSAVTISRGAQHLQAMGMRASLDDRRVELLSQVKGRYELDAHE